MSMSPNGPAPKVPTMPRGNEIAVYSTYLKAQKAVDTLSDEGFEVQTVTIVGHDLHMVERVTGRLTYGRVAFAGFASGAWVGLFLGLMIMLFASDGGGTGLMLTAILFGGASGLLFSIISYALTGGKRDFTSQSQVVAARYVLLCAPETAGRARAILTDKGVGGDLNPTMAPRTVVSQPAAPAGAPQYGVRVDNPTTGVGGGVGTLGASDGAQTGAADGAPTGAAPTAAPLTYGEALDAQRRAERAQASSHGAGTSGAVSPAPQTSTNNDVSGSATGVGANNSSEDSDQSPSAQSASQGGGSRRELRNPDNPFSPPKDEN